MACSRKQLFISMLISGLMMGIIGAVLFATFPTIMKQQIRKRLVLKEGTIAYKNWKNIPVPIYINFYFFNVTNQDDVYNNSKPILEQVGPYVYRVDKEKRNITFHENGTVSYQFLTKYFFQSDRTNGSLDDTIVTLNVPMVAASAEGKRRNNALIYYSLNYMFHHLNCTLLISRTVDEFLFKGYEDELLQAAKAFIDIPYDKFGWFYEKNNTVTDVFEVYTGEDDIMDVDKVYTWNDKQSVDGFAEPCNMVNGTTGDAFRPGLTRETKLTMFVPQLCRSLTFTYLEDVYVDGILTYRYWSDNTQLDNGAIDPDHKCFCSDTCLPPGAHNVSSCAYNAPAVVSYPHFLYADPIYSEGVIGMKPNPDEHRMYFDLIPEMGIPLHVAARMQINVVLEKVKQLVDFSNITRRTYWPMLAFSETAEAGPDITDQIKFPLVTLPVIMKAMEIAMMGIGFVLMLAGLILTVLYALGKIPEKERDIKKKKNSTEKP